MLTSDPVSGSFFKLIVAEFLLAFRFMDSIGKFLLFDSNLKYPGVTSEGAIGSEKYKLIFLAFKFAELRILLGGFFEVS